MTEKRTYDDLAVRKMYLDLGTARSNQQEHLAFTHMRVSDVSSNAAVASIKFQSNQNKAIDIFEGRRFKNWPVDRVFFSNTAQAGEWIELEYWGGPAFGAPEIIDSALTATLNGGTVTTVDEVTKVTENTQLEALLKNDDDKRNALTDLSDCTIGYASNATTTLVSAGANVNGIIVRHAGVNARSQASNCDSQIYLDSSSEPIARANVGASQGGSDSMMLRDFFIPAGKALTLDQANGGGACFCYYKVL